MEDLLKGQHSFEAHPLIEISDGRVYVWERWKTMRSSLSTTLICHSINLQAEFLKLEFVATQQFLLTAPDHTAEKFVRIY